MDAQGSQTNAKEDTVFLALDGDLVTDLSQYETDLTVATGGGFELESARAALTGSTGREVYVRCTLSAAEASVVLAAHSTTVEFAYTWLIRTNASGNLECVQGNTFVGLTVVWQGPVVPAADLSIGWSTRPNPDTTGSSDALISEIIVYDHDAGAYLAIDQVVHAAPTTASGLVLSVGGVHSSGSLTSRPTNAPTAFRLSRSFHTNVEFAEDWIAARPAHATSLVTPREPIGASLAAIGNVAQWAGQPNVGFIGAHANALRGRMLSPLVNEVYSQARTLISTPTPTQWLTFAPGSATYRADVTTLRWLPVPGVEWAYVRVHVTSWVTSGDPVPIGVRAYSMNRPHRGIGPTIQGQPTPALSFTFAGATLTEDHTGAGEWLELGLLKLSPMAEPIPGWSGATWLCLAHAFDAESNNDANARLRINAWQVRPILGEP